MGENISLLEKLEKQKAKLASRIQSVKTRKKVSDRKQEMRRKILVGSYYLDEARKSGEFGKLKEIIGEYLKRDSDRALFELSDTPKNESE